MTRKILIFIVAAFIVFFHASSALFSEEPGGGGASLLKNGDFSDGTNQWTLWSDEGRADMAIENGEAKISVTNPGPQLWSIGLSQHGFPIKYGETYTVTFRARADKTREIRSVIQLARDPWTGYSAATSFTLTGKMTTFSYAFTMYYETDNEAELQIFVGQNGKGTIYLDNITLTKYGEGVAERNFPVVKPSVDRSNIIIYQIVPGSYNGGYWDGGNCFKGIIRRLEKIKELGVNCIWLTPVFLGEGMGYWTFNYYMINPKLGTLNDLKELVYEAHKRNIMLILDLCINHTWTRHPFFQDVLKNKDKSPYRDYYLWKGEPGASDYVYYFDWNTIPNLNVKNREVREYLYAVAVYWVKKLDIDGYRVDVAWGPEDRFPGFGAELKKRLAAVKPDVFLLAEGNVNEARFFKNGYDSAYDWDVRGFGYTDKNIFPGLFDGSKTPKQLYDALTRKLPANGLPFRFIENQDHPRAASLWGAAASQAAYAIVLTSRGYPNVFGGAEVGFAPSADHEYSQDDPVVWDYHSPLFAYFKQLIAIRNQYLKSDLKQYWIENNSKSVYSSLSVSGDNKLIVIVNCADRGTAVMLKLNYPELGNIHDLTDIMNRTSVPYDGKGSLTVTLGGYETKILLVK